MSPGVIRGQAAPRAFPGTAPAASVPEDRGFRKVACPPPPPPNVDVRRSDDLFARGLAVALFVIAVLAVVASVVLTSKGG